MSKSKKVLFLELDESVTLDEVREILEDYKKQGVVAQVKINNRVIQNDFPENKIDNELKIAFMNSPEEKINAAKKEKEKLYNQLIFLQNLQISTFHRYYLNTIIIFIKEEKISDFYSELFNLKSTLNSIEFEIALQLLSSILLICNNYPNDHDKYLELNKIFATIPRDENVYKDYILDMVLIIINKYSIISNELPEVLLENNVEKYKKNIEEKIKEINATLSKNKPQ